MRTFGSALVINLGVLAASIVVVFGVAEGALALRDWRWRTRFDDQYGRRLLCTAPSDDPRLLYTMRAGECDANSQGYPDAEHTLAKPDGVFRIVVIGDSIAAGQGVERPERFASLLAASLNRTDRPVEVITLARPGYSTAQELVILEKEAFAYRPDLVIWAYCLNDPADPIYHDANGELGRYYFRPSSYAVHYVRKLVFRARENWAKAGCGDDYHSVLHCVYRDAIEHSIEAIGSVAREHQTPVLFAILPVFDRDTTPLVDIHRMLASFAGQAGLVAVDMQPEFRDAPGTFALPASGGAVDPWHPNAAGHARIAQRLALEARKYLDHPDAIP